jgi:hypothetical protein
MAEEVVNKIQSIIQHFSAPGFELPISEEEREKRSPLSEREMMFLACHFEHLGGVG